MQCRHTASHVRPEYVDTVQVPNPRNRHGSSTEQLGAPALLIYDCSVIMRTLHDHPICMGLVRRCGRVSLLSPHRTEFRGVRYILVDTQLTQVQVTP